MSDSGHVLFIRHFPWNLIRHFPWNPSDLGTLPMTAPECAPAVPLPAITMPPFTASSPPYPATLPQAAGRRYMLLSGSSDRLRIAILDDHPVITLGVAAYHRSQPDFDLLHAETTISEEGRVGKEGGRTCNSRW